MGTTEIGFTKAKLHQHQENAHSSMHTLAFKDTNGVIGQLLIFKKLTIKKNRLKNHHPSKILGFFSIEGKCEAVIQCHTTTFLEYNGKIFLIR
jgi:hypothetical protein